MNESRRFNTPVRCISFSRDASLIAVGESGGLLSIRSRSGDVVASVTHGSAVRCVSFNHNRNDCVSGGEESIRVWLSDMHAFFRIAVPRPCLCEAWSLDGYSFVFGLVDGQFGLVDRNQLDSRVFMLTFSSTIWCCTFLNSEEIVIGTWDPPELILINSLGRTVVDRTRLLFNPTCVHRLSDHMFFVGDKRGNVLLYGTSSEGNISLLKSMVETESGFVTSINMHSSDCLIVSTFSGSLSCYRIRFNNPTSISPLMFVKRNPSCFSQLLIYSLGVSSISVFAFTPFCSAPKLINAMGLVDDKLSILADDRFIRTFRFIDNHMQPMYEFQIEHKYQPVQSIYPSIDGVILTHNEGTQFSLFTTTGQLINSVSIPSPIELITPISKSTFFILSTSGEISFLSPTLTLHKHSSTPCHRAQSMSTSLHKTCIAILEYSGDMFVFDRTVQVYSSSNVTACLWSTTVDGLLLFTKSDQTVWIWDRCTQRHWVIDAVEQGTIPLKFLRDQIFLVDKLGEWGKKSLSLNKMILDILKQDESIFGINRAYQIGVQCGCESRVLDTLGESALRLGQILVARICFRKSNNRRLMFLTTLPNIGLCPDGYLDLAKGHIENGVIKLWNVSEETRKECIQILMRFNYWSVLLNLCGPKCLRETLESCDDRYAAGRGYLEIGDLKNAIAAFISAGANEHVMLCFSEETRDIALEYFDSVDDWDRLCILLGRFGNPKQTSEAHAKRNRWNELYELSRRDSMIKPYYLMLHGKYLACIETKVTEGLWEQIQSGLVSDNEISLQCNEWTQKFVNAKNYRLASCIAAIDPCGSRDVPIVMHAYAIVVEEQTGNSPFSVHDPDLVLNAALYLHNLGEVALRKVIADIDPSLVVFVLIQRLFDSGNHFSAVEVFRDLHNINGLPTDLRHDLGALCENETFCEDNPEYAINCFTCNVRCGLLSLRESCQSCGRPFHREMCLMDVISGIPKSEGREFGRTIFRQGELPIILCLYCKNAFAFFKYIDDTKCIICHCLWCPDSRVCIQ